MGECDNEAEDTIPHRLVHMHGHRHHIPHLLAQDIRRHSTPRGKMARPPRRMDNPLPADLLNCISPNHRIQHLFDDCGVCVGNERMVHRRVRQRRGCGLVLHSFKNGAEPLRTLPRRAG